MGTPNLVRCYVVEKYIEPGRRRHDVKVRVIAGEVHRALKLSQRIPLVCNALRSEKFLRANSLELEKLEGPPSKQGPNVVFTYRLKPGAQDHRQTVLMAFHSIYGIGKDVFLPSVAAKLTFNLNETASTDRKEINEPGLLGLDALHLRV